MFRFRILIFLALFGVRAQAQQGDEPNARMEPVVPANLIPPSPVLSVADALKTFSIAPGFVIEPVAVEPMIEAPVCLDFDPSGRMWVCEMRNFMPNVDGKGEDQPAGRIVILGDTDHNGQADKRTVFLENLVLPRAVAVLPDGVLFADEKTISWIQRDGDEPVGQPKVITSIAAVGNVEHKPNALLPNIDNRYYFAKFDKRLKRVGDQWELEPTAFRGQWGIARDDYGRLYHNNNSTLLFADLVGPDELMGNPGMKIKSREFVQLAGNHVWPARMNPAVNRAYMSKAHGFDHDTLDPKTFKLIDTTAAAGMTLYRGTNFPAEWRNTGFITEPVCNLVAAIRITEKDGTPEGKYVMEGNEFLTSTDERFRPVNIYNSPDGCLYLLDMYHGIIQHKTFMTSYLRKQSVERGLDKPENGLGRIYRIRYKGGQVDPLGDIAALPPQRIVALLESRNPWQRETAQRLLVARKDLSVVPDLEKVARQGSAVGRIHALWTLEGMGALKAEHVAFALQSSDVKLQCSALWAATRLPMADLQKLGPVMLRLQPSGPEVLPYLARAIGPIGTPEVFARLGELLQKNPKGLLLPEATVAGLDGHEDAFRDSQLKGSKDEKMLHYLDDATKKPGGDAPPLTGAALASFQRGKAMFHGEAACFGCHGADGAGVANLGPPLDESQWVTGKPETLISILLHGLVGPITVAGENYNPTAEMPALGSNPAMTDQALADIATYVRREWSNTAGPVNADVVKRERRASASRTKPWTASELPK